MWKNGSTLRETKVEALEMFFKGNIAIKLQTLPQQRSKAYANSKWNSQKATKHTEK